MVWEKTPFGLSSSHPHAFLISMYAEVIIFPTQVLIYQVTEGLVIEFLPFVLG